MSNCVLSATGHGEYAVTVLSISHGIRIIAGSPDSARNHRAFYLSKRTSATFTLGLVFTTHADYARFGRWLQEYGTGVSTPNTPVGAMKVYCPARSFVRVGVPVAGATFGDQVGRIAFPMMLRFDGARETDDFASPIAAKFIDSDFNTEESAFFYPAGKQLKGGERTEDALYGTPGESAAAAKIIATIRGLFGGGAGVQR